MGMSTQGHRYRHLLVWMSSMVLVIGLGYSTSEMVATQPTNVVPLTSHDDTTAVMDTMTHAIQQNSDSARYNSIGAWSPAPTQDDGDTSPQWLVLLYIGADDGALPKEGLQAALYESVEDLVQRLDVMPPNPAMQLIVQVDGPYDQDTVFYQRSPTDTELRVTGWTELDTGSTKALEDFVRSARQQHPTIPYTLLAIVDHGGGWSPDFDYKRNGGPQSPVRVAFQSGGGWRGMSIDTSSRTSFSTRETREAFESLGAMGTFDVLFFDACLMGMVESMYEVSDHADYMVAGQNLLWSRFPYDQYLHPAVLTAETTPDMFAGNLVQQYNQPVNTQEPFTIAAIDTRKLSGVQTAVDLLAASLLDAWDTAPDPATVEATIRTAYQQTQKFDYDSSLRIDETDGYVDLVHFAQHIRTQNVTPAVNIAADGVIQAVIGNDHRQGAVLDQRTVSGTPLFVGETWDLNHAHGLSIYVPLGERDCRPTGSIVENTSVPTLTYNDPCYLPNGANEPREGEPSIVNQLSYYVYHEKAAVSHLQFTKDTPHWGDLLLRLDETTPVRDLSLRPFVAPFHARSFVGVELQYTYLPLLE